MGILHEQLYYYNRDLHFYVFKVIQLYKIRTKSTEFTPVRIILHATSRVIIRLHNSDLLDKPLINHSHYLEHPYGAKTNFTGEIKTYISIFSRLHSYSKLEQAALNLPTFVLYYILRVDL